MALIEQKLSDKLTTSVTSGAYVYIIIPDGLGGFLSRKIAFATLKDAINLELRVNKGFFLTSAALIAAYPVGEDGWEAVVGESDTVWLWDSDTSAWVDSYKSGFIISINGMTGVVVLTANDIAYTATTGLVSTLVGDAIDELKTYVDNVVVGGGTRSKRGVSCSGTVGQVIPFSSAFTADCNIFILDYNDLGIRVTAQDASGFTITSLTAGLFGYSAIANE